MTSLAIHAGPWDIQRAPREQAAEMIGYARTRPHDVLPVYLQVDTLLASGSQTHVHLALPEQTIAPTKQPVQVMRRTLQAVSSAIGETPLTNGTSSQPASHIAVSLVDGLYLPPAAELMERPEFAAMRTRTPEEQAQHAVGIGFIAVTGRKDTPRFGVGYADPYKGVYMIETLPINMLLLALRKSRGKYIERPPATKFKEYL